MTKSQQQAFDKFKQLKIGALFMKMGTGKTKVALDLVNYNQVDLLIYVCPFSTKNNIQNEIDKWGVNCNYIIIGYETIQASDEKYVELLNKIANKKCFLIADESIFIKNENTKRFNRLCEIRNKCEYALILNGTPITKNEWDIYNQIYFLSPKIIGLNRNDFLNTFFTHIVYKKRNEKEKDFYKFSEINAEYLKKLISPYIFECDLDFEKQEHSTIKYIDCQKTEYELKKEEKLKEYLASGESETIINMLTNLNVIASCSFEKNKKVAEYIANKKIICFCNFIKEIEEIKSLLNDNCYLITGETKNRNEIIDNFKNDNKPLLMTFGCGSYSLNLQFCNEIVYSSLNFDFGDIEQSKYRIKRLGQSQDIKYTYILSDFGINKMILENLDKKTTLGNLIKEKINGGVEWLKNI